ncbi:carbohydrate binding domain-containing protein [Phytohabitans flavus]|uniref:carbohydrate binding domain-containing protein n=1 Tax=Phytohabitans flavus TaxID=1076124 RepID=UPI003627D24E
MTRRPTAILAALAAAFLAATALTGTAHAEEVEHIDNGTFDGTTAPWWNTPNTPIAAVDGRLCAEVPGGTANPWDASIGHNDIPLVDGDAYRLTFTASATASGPVRANVQLNETPFTTALSREVVLTTTPQTFTYEFDGNIDSTNGAFTFQLGGSANPFTFCLGDVSLTSEGSAGGGGPEQVENGDFNDGTAGWYSYGTTSTAVLDGRLCSEVPGGLANPWDAGVGQNGVPLVAGSAYTFSFDASAAPGATVRAAVQLGVDPFTAYLSRDVTVTGETQHLEFTFTSPVDTDQAQVAFQVGANPTAYTLCLDNVSLLGGEEEPPYVPETGPRVRVNQAGYLPSGPKGATVVTTATEALPWQLKNGGGTVVASGQTAPRGTDQASGQNVHTVDFGSFKTVGTGYTLTADGETSHPFDIAGDVFKQLRSDSSSSSTPSAAASRSTVG